MNGEEQGIGWVVLEAMGHVRQGGYLTEATISGAGFLRLEIPADGDDPAVTQLWAPGSIYRITPVAEDMARAVAKGNRPTPVQRWELPAGRVQSGPPEESPYDTEYEPDDDEEMEEPDEPEQGTLARERDRGWD